MVGTARDNGHPSLPVDPEMPDRTNQNEFADLQSFPFRHDRQAPGDGERPA
jgi:hypothetical protein